MTRRGEINKKAVQSEAQENEKSAVLSLGYATYSHGKNKGNMFRHGF
jgi:hypothetical protein